MRSALSTKMLVLTGGLLMGIAPAWSMGDVVLSPTSYYPAYTPTVLNYASTRGGILTQVVGNPFDVSKEELERTVTGIMAGSHFGPRVAFITEPPEGYRLPYRVVLLFDAKRGHSSHALCGPGVLAAPLQMNDKLRVHAALCAGDAPLTAVSGTVRGPVGLNDSRFRKLLGQITTNLFPPNNPDRQPDIIIPG
jgi:hypothetical protein